MDSVECAAPCSFETSGCKNLYWTEAVFLKVDLNPLYLTSMGGFPYLSQWYLCCGLLIQQV